MESRDLCPGSSASEAPELEGPPPSNSPGSAILHDAWTQVEEAPERRLTAQGMLSGLRVHSSPCAQHLGRDLGLDPNPTHSLRQGQEERLRGMSLRWGIQGPR